MIATNQMCRVHKRMILIFKLTHINILWSMIYSLFELLFPIVMHWSLQIAQEGECGVELVYMHEIVNFSNETEYS